ncbi:DMT family transporter [Agrobacterium radiobacter]|uniref:DMT family transporter n=1 Tax=Agrobacterium radiobacter TaxID=362 RepID=UPI0016057B74|nr:DMT family transporter [Agrobacterium radiobacter]MBB4408090.1 drug/metabolite transporter (DMT)-like permease [Agrobacterium radiobacter]MBB4453461.1 drug/metabolite transporter (DMT)-like permease [Agrobacterium radiobacter]
MPIYELAAVGAATCWAITGLLAAGPAGRLGALAFNRTRQLFVAALLGVYMFASGSWRELQPEALSSLLLSGFIGIFVGDTLLFTCLNRLGPRRSGILFALNAPIAALLAWAVLGEQLPASAITGIGLTLSGVLLAILFGKRKAQLHEWESVKGSLWLGVLFGLLAALSQAVGSLIARPVMATGIDPLAASMLRVGVAALCLTALTMLPIEAVRPRGPMTRSLFLQTAFTGIIALAFGMTLLLFALSGGKVGIVSTLSATTPVIILPLLWLRTREVPAPGAWAGAALVVAGMALMFWR